MQLNKTAPRPKTRKTVVKAPVEVVQATPAEAPKDGSQAILEAVAGLCEVIGKLERLVVRQGTIMMEMRDTMQSTSDLLLEAVTRMEAVTSVPPRGEAIDEGDDDWITGEDPPMKLIGIAGLIGSQQTNLAAKLEGFADIVWIDHTRTKPPQIGPLDHLYVTKFVDGGWMTEVRKLFHGRFTKVNGTSAIVEAVLGT